MRVLLILLGLVALIMGLLWVAQGLGIVSLPVRGFMPPRGEWTLYGGILASIGLIMFIGGLRRN